MAQETKVGLLAGLAFIICFAVILTNRGNERFGDADFGQPPTGPATHAAMPSRQSSEPSRPTSNTRKITQSEPRAPQTGWQRPSHSSEPIRESNPTTAIHPVWRTQPAPQNIIAAPITGTRNVEDPHLANAGRNPAQASAIQDRLERRLDELAAEVRNQRLANSVNAQERRGGPTVGGQPLTESRSTALSARSTPVQATPNHGNRRSLQYTVVSGDSLSKIARLFYGSGSKTVVNAIFDANRSVLPSVDQLRAGLKITLPSVAGVDGPRGGRAQPSPPSPATGQPIHHHNGAKPRDPQWYEIQKNDRYAKIAREQLGDESRWREIFELNKDKFPKPGMIRPGVRIRLPERRIASAGNGRH